MHRLALCGAVFALGMLFYPALAADAFKLKAGQWDFETTAKLATMPEPRTTKSSRCVEADADPLEAITSGSRCSFSKREQTGNKLEWEMECAGGTGGETMKGKGEVTSDGSSAQGKIEWIMSLQGREMKMSSTWSGKRKGPCKP